MQSSLRAAPSQQHVVAAADTGCVLLQASRYQPLHPGLLHGGGGDGFGDRGGGGGLRATGADCREGGLEPLVIAGKQLPAPSSPTQ